MMKTVLISLEERLLTATAAPFHWLSNKPAVEVIYKAAHDIYNLRAWNSSQTEPTYQYSWVESRAQH